MDQITSHADMLGQLAAIAQFLIAFVLAAFFAAIARGNQQPASKAWAAAWAFDVAALAAIFTTFGPTALPAFRPLANAAYAFAKTAFLLAVLEGARRHLGFPHLRRPATLAVLAGITAWAVAITLVGGDFAVIQVAQYGLVGVIATAGGVGIWRRAHDAATRWLAASLVVEGVLFAHYVPLLIAAIADNQPPVRYLAYGSSFDAGAELLIALSSLVALERRSGARLRSLNDELRASQARLRQIVDIDPLTGLLNRHTLRDRMQRAQESGAAIAFVDLDDLKEVNDSMGHLAGDECLRRVAVGLGQRFRGEDSLFRWGGDEFLVVAPGLSAGEAEDRLADLQTSLGAPGDDRPPCSISWGVTTLIPGGAPDVALRTADALMYRRKTRRPARTGARRGAPAGRNV